jgi:hypothetical protein
MAGSWTHRSAAFGQVSNAFFELRGDERSELILDNLLHLAFLI